MAILQWVNLVLIFCCRPFRIQLQQRRIRPYFPIKFKSQPASILQLIQIVNCNKMQGIKRKRRCDSDCEDHILDIKANKGVSSKYDFCQQFCPKYQREPMPPEHTYPEYNNDGKYYTTAFILGVDRRVLNKNDLQEIMDHQKLIRDSLQKHNQLVFPRPNSKHSLCSVCKEQYKNYYIHIASDEHGERISLSPYNQHILGLCNRYIELWEGAEQRADEEAQRRAAQDKIRREKQEEQRMEEDDDDDDDEIGSLLDVDRGENADLDDDRDQDDQQGLYTVKPNQSKSKKKPRSVVFIDQDTVPLTAKPSKRSNPDGHHHHHEYPRKKFIANDINPIRALRMHQEKKYERQRQKTKSGRDCVQNREFVLVPANEGDIFSIFKMIHPIVPNMELLAKKQIFQDKLKKQFEKTIENIEKMQPIGNQIQKQSLSGTFYFEINGKIKEMQIIYAKSPPTEIEKIHQNKEIIKSKIQQIQPLTNVDTSKYKQTKVQKFPYPQRIEKNENSFGASFPSSINRSEYHKKLPDGNKYGPQTFKHLNQSYKYFPQNRYPQIIKGGHQYSHEHYKGMQQGYKVHSQNKSQNYKSSNPNNYNYYNPYIYNAYEPPYRDKGYEYPPNDKDKTKSAQKPYQYMPYAQWPYHHPPPYYIPPVPPHSQQINPPHQPNSDQPGPNPPKANINNMPNPYVGGTSININFPMYMCPPPPHHSLQGMSYSVSPSRYPMPPMIHNPYNIGYQYPQYANNQQASGRQGEYPNQLQTHGLTIGHNQPQSQIKGSQNQQIHPITHQLASNQRQMPNCQHPNYEPNYMSHQYSSAPYLSHQHTAQIPTPKLAPHK